jgi:endoglucanase
MRRRRLLAGLLSTLLLTSSVSLVNPAPATAAGAGYWHTSGRQLLDANNDQTCTAA